MNLSVSVTSTILPLLKTLSLESELWCISVNIFPVLSISLGYFPPCSVVALAQLISHTPVCWPPGNFWMSRLFCFLSFVWPIDTQVRQLLGWPVSLLPDLQLYPGSLSPWLALSVKAKHCSCVLATGLPDLIPSVVCCPSLISFLIYLPYIKAWLPFFSERFLTSSHELVHFFFSFVSCKYTWWKRGIYYSSLLRNSSFTLTIWRQKSTVSA